MRTGKQAGRIVPIVVFLLAALAVARVGHAQTANPAANISTVVRGGVVVVSYDLISSNPAAEFSVALEVSSDGGKTYNVRPKTLKGDVGPTVRAGMGKQITWEAARDVENLQVDQYRYRVVAQPVRAQAPATGSPPRAQPPAVTQANQPPAVVQGSGNGRKWGGIALMGVGGALAVLSQTESLKREVCDEVDCWLEKNTPLLWAGIGAAAGGVALLAIGGSNDSVGTRIVIRPRGVTVQHRLRFGGITRADGP